MTKWTACESCGQQTTFGKTCMGCSNAACVGQRPTVIPPAKPGRAFDQGRYQQGFKSQEHLDAWFASYDHHKTCPGCNGPGTSYWNEADASWQPVGPASCAVGMELFFAASFDRFTQEVPA